MEAATRLDEHLALVQRALALGLTVTLRAGTRPIELRQRYNERHSRNVPRNEILIRGARWPYDQWKPAEQTWIEPVRTIMDCLRYSPITDGEAFHLTCQIAIIEGKQSTGGS